ncbi:filamentous hemagglutinin [Cricetibacter osteomyelitidis]|uniref:Filamentous hemagglutinin n=1 Tax=Cricetibacter osteomyelitidis TaxID=1521931 RepID=A0A4R2TCT6_9PAST|nr:hemagglutinin repeat-containing protein [Cricetibacter osteomyelitidis]TCP94918.1 filamentous hemagglutinin [Cricetibacter osteomyelitidis]
MNKQCFRVIFSKTRQRLIVTSELAKSADKSTSPQSAVNSDIVFATLKPLAFSLFCALGFVTFSASALSDTLIIKADPNARKNQQPIVLQTANGLPQVNIQTPNEKGLSHNKYRDFNVDTKGAILNNSYNATKTQQAGLVQSNPYLARGEAKVILNEVTSTNPSRLKGYLEVAGKKAEVIIANPNGLHCDGCGTINATRSTLTTGKPQIKDGRVDGFKVEKGKVKISGKGLDNSRVDYTDILAREAEINAGVWAGKKLNVVTGANKVKQADIAQADSDLTITRIDAKKLAENTPHFALDVSELGGMYAGKIHLVGTEQGLGVRNAGHIGASHDRLTIDAQGKIVNTGTLNAQQQISLKTPKNIENTGRIEAKTQNVELQSHANITQNGSVIARIGKVKATAKNTLSQHGETVAKGNISYKAAEVTSTQSSLIAAGVTTTPTAHGETRQLDSQTAQGANIDIQADKTTQLAGRNIASGKLNIAAQSVNLDNSKNNAYDIAIQAKSGDVQANHAQLSAVENLQISTPQTLSTQHSQLTANRIQTSQQDLNTQHAVWLQSGTDEFNLNARSIQNQGGTLSTGGNFNLNAENVDNTDGQFIAGRSLNIHTTGEFNSTQGTLFANNTLKLQTAQLTNTNGLIKSIGNMHIDTGNHNLLNQQTNTNSDTQKGIIALGNLVINSATLHNTQGKIATAQNLTVNAQALTNTQGVINAQQQATIQAAQIDNQRGTIWGANTHLNATTINNQKNGQTGSLIGATDTLTVTVAQLNNQQTVATDTKPTQGLQAKNIQLNADTLNNQQGGIYATNTISAAIKNQLNNQAGEFLARKTVQIHSQTDHLMVDNQDGTIEAGQQLSLKAKTLQHEGTIKTQGDAEIALTDSFTLNRAFQVGNNLIFSTQGDLLNNVKQVVGNQALFTAKNLINHANAEISSNRTLINTETVTNYGLLDGTENIIKTGTLNNIATGRIYGDHLAIQADNLNNLNNDEKSATIAARKRLDLGVGILTNQDHSLIFSIGDIAVGGQLNEQNQATGHAKLVDNGSATIEALGNGDIKTQRLFNHDLHLKLGEYHTNERIIEYAPSKTSTRYVLQNGQGKQGHFDLKNNSKRDSNSYLILKDGKRIASRYWTTWNYNRHTVTSTIEYRDPAKILIGGDLSLSGSNLENNASTLSIGKTLLLGDSIFTRNENNSDLTAGGITLKNIDIQGNIDITDTGKWESFGKERHRYGARGKKRWAVYGKGSGNINDIHPTEHFTFNKVLNDIGNEIVGTNTTIDSQSNSAPVTLTLPTVSAVISGQVSANHTENLADGTQPIIKTHLAEITLPKASLYQINPEAPNGYVVETDSQFTDRKRWLSSDYMFNALRYDHNNVQKRLGDGFYEQRLVNEQINQLTGRRFLDNYSSDFEQYKALMDSGVYYADKFKLTPGVGLTAEQMAELTSDMVWLVNKEVTLPSGKTLTVLTPQVYLVARNFDVTTQGALISAREIVGNINGNITNTGMIAGRDLTALSANNITNNGVVLGNTVNLSAEQTLVNLGGKIQALDSATLIGKQGIEIASQTSSAENHDIFGNAFAHTNIDRRADIDVNGKLTIFSPKDVVLKAANVNADVIHIQGHNVELGTVSTANKQHYNADADNYYRLDQTQEISSHLKAKNDVNIISENHTALRQASVHSDNGTVAIGSINGDVQIQEGRSQEQLSFGAKSTHNGMLQTTITVSKHDHAYDVAQGSTIDGNNVLLQANKGNMTIQGSNVVAENNLTATAKNINIQEAENRLFEQDFEKTKKSGLMGGGGFGFSIGQRKLTTETDQTKYTATQSQVGSLSGNTTLLANENYRQSASSVTAVDGDVTIQAQHVDVLAASDKYKTNYKQTYEKKGLTIAINTPIQTAINAVKSVTEAVKTVGESKDDRINAMAAANAGWGAYRAGQTLGKVGQELGELMQNGTVPTEAVSVSITYGEQKNVDTHHTEGSTANNSQVNAGGNVTITATGADKQSNINIIGSDVSGKQGTTLTADNDINLNAQQQTHKERTQNKSSGFNAGVAIAVGNGVSFGITAGGNYGKGYGNGDDVTYRHAHLGDSSSQTTINAGNNATLKGAQVQGKSVTLNAENLTIESLQDTMKYQGKQMNVSGQVTVGYGASGSASYNQSKINADYASVVEQSGIYAGDDGYQINVGNHTALTGGIVTSGEKAEQGGKNSFSTGTLSATDIENHANYKGSAFGVSGSATVGGGESAKEMGGVNLMSLGSNNQVQTVDVQTGDVTTHTEGTLSVNKSIGFGYDKDSQSSVTKSGINTANIKIKDSQTQFENTGKTIAETLSAIKTNIMTENAAENSGVLTNNFDKDRVQKELNTQVKVTQEFDKNRQDIKAELLAKADKLFAEAKLERYKNGGNETEKSKELENQAHNLSQLTSYIDTALGTAWGLTNSISTAALQVTAQHADYAKNAGTHITAGSVYKVDCSGGVAQRYCREMDDKTRKTEWEGGAREIYDINEIQNKNGKNVIISNPGIYNSKYEAFRNAVKQNPDAAENGNLYVVLNSPSYEGIPFLSEVLFYASYDKLNETIGAKLPLTYAERTNMLLNKYAAIKGLTLEKSNHSRGSLTESVSLQYTNNHFKDKNGKPIPIPLEKVRFVGAAANAERYYGVLENNGYVNKNGVSTTFGQASHNQDFVALPPVILGGNTVTGGACGKLCYSHSGYYGKVPDEFLKGDNNQPLLDQNGKKIKNLEYKEYVELWGEPKKDQNGNLINVSAPNILIRDKDGKIHLRNSVVVNKFFSP